ncbi:MAG: hypothetical protein ACXV2F_03615 [Halobacteriota archaeon]
MLIVLMKGFDKVKLTVFTHLFQRTPGKWGALLARALGVSALSLLHTDQFAFGFSGVGIGSR